MASHNPPVDMLGQRLGYVVVLARAPTPPGATKAYWKCRCDCGKVFERAGCALRASPLVSCGCQRNKKAAPKPRQKKLKYSPHKEIHLRDTHPLRAVLMGWVTG